VSDSLRDALEKLATEWSERSTGYDEYRELRALLAAHTVEPAPDITREVMEIAVEAASAAWNDGPRAAIRAALEAAAPLLGWRPTLEEIAEAMHDHVMETHRWRQGCRQDVCIDIFLDRASAVLALLNGE
jgi:hypothetical protein